MKEGEKDYKYPLRLDARLKPHLEEAVVERGLSMNGLLEFAVRYFLEKEYPNKELPKPTSRWQWQKQQIRAQPPKDAPLFAGT